MDTILVTGGAGFVGANLVRQLIAVSQVRIVNLDNLGRPEALASLESIRDDPQHLFVKGDVRDRTLVAELLERHQCRAIVHCAGEANVDRSIGCPANFFGSHVTGTFELLEQSLEYWDGLEGSRREDFRFLHVSCDEVFGSLGPGDKCTERTPFAPNSPYAATKAAADHLVRTYHRTYGLPTLICNCSDNYGPFQSPDNLVPLTIRNLLRGHTVAVYGQGNNIRDWLHVDDHCRALRLMLERGRPGETYNVGGNCERTNLDVVMRICDAIDRLRPGLPHHPCASLIRFVVDRPAHDVRHAVCNDKIERELGWRPCISFAEGLEQTIRWYLENWAWFEQGTESTTAFEDPLDRGQAVSTGTSVGLPGAFAPEMSSDRRSDPAAKVSEPGGRTSEPTALPETFPIRGRAADPDQPRLDASPADADPPAIREERTVNGGNSPREQPIDGVIFSDLIRQINSRGWSIDLFRDDKLSKENWPVMATVSETLPGVARGPHEHVDHTDYIAFFGPADFRLYLWDARVDSPTYGNRVVRVVGQSNPQTVIIPPGVVHAYKNISRRPGCVFYAPNRIYSEGDFDAGDTIRHEQRKNSPFVLHEDLHTG